VDEKSIFPIDAIAQAIALRGIAGRRDRRHRTRGRVAARSFGNTPANETALMVFVGGGVVANVLHMGATAMIAGLPIRQDGPKQTLPTVIGLGQLPASLIGWTRGSSRKASVGKYRQD
jgi:hypothetical protein